MMSYRTPLNPDDPIVYSGGNWMPQSEATVPFMDSGFWYGDGLFETLLVSSGKLFRPHKHLERMRAGMAILEIEFPVSEKELIGLLEEMVRRNRLTESTLRLMLTRGTVPGAPFKFSGPANLYIGLRYTQPEPAFPVKVIFANEADYPVARRSPAIKSMTYLWNMLAIREANRQGAFEPVFVNGGGVITECAVRNIFFIDGDILRTPDLSLGILQGVTRDLVLELAPAQGLTIDTSPITREAANHMDEAFIASTGIGIYPVTWEGYGPREYPRTGAIRDAVEKQVRDELGG